MNGDELEQLELIGRDVIPMLRPVPANQAH